MKHAKLFLQRVSIAEMLLSFSPLGFWDNSTRGLDASSALSFVRTLRLSADLAGTAQAVAAYQASQAMYDVFDKVVVLYEGREIYFGPTKSAKKYFADMGWLCPSRQTTPDFLTSVTNVQERQPRPGYEAKVPRTAAEFEEYWQMSEFYMSLRQEIKRHEEEVSDSVAATEFKGESSRTPYRPDFLGPTGRTADTIFRAHQRHAELYKHIMFLQLRHTPFRP
jgi:ABC-type multidrug transport system ATPase subunit